MLDAQATGLADASAASAPAAFRRAHIAVETDTRFWETETLTARDQARFDAFERVEEDDSGPAPTSGYMA